MSESLRSPNRGWLVVTAGLGVNLVLGALYAWSVIARALATLPDGKQWTKVEASAPFAVGTSAFAITMIFAGKLQDRFGPKIAAILGGALLGIGFMTASFARTPLTMMLTFGVLGGMGIGLGYAATTPAALKWFHPSRKGLIAGIVVAGVGLAAVYMAPLAEVLLVAFKGDDPWQGISKTLLTLGIGTIVIVWALAPLLRNPPAGYVPQAKAKGNDAQAHKPASAADNMNWPGMIKTRTFYLLWAMFVLAAAPGLMLLANARDIAAAQAPDWKAGVVLVMTIAIFNTMGRLVGGYVSDQIGRTRTMLLFFILQAVNMACFSLYQGAGWLIFGTAAAGLLYGAIFTLMPAATADFYGLKNLGVNFGILFTAFGVAGVTGSMLGGRVRDLTQTYYVAYWIVAGMLVVAAALALLARPPQTKRDEPC